MPYFGQDPTEELLQMFKQTTWKEVLRGDRLKGCLLERRDNTMLPSRWRIQWCSNGHDITICLGAAFLGGSFYKAEMVSREGNEPVVDVYGCIYFHLKDQVEVVVYPRDYGKLTERECRSALL